MNIDQLLGNAREHQQDPSADSQLVVPKQWTQGRTAFGGLSAAMVYAAVREQVADDRVLRSFTCNFVGPLQANTPFSIAVNVLRQGKNVTQVMAQLQQQEQIALQCQLCFGVARESKIKVEPTEKHSMTLPKKAKFIPHIPKITPSFLTQFDLAIERGKLPFTGSDSSDIDGWMRFKHAPKSVSDAHLICLIDAWPPTVLQQLRWPAPASTISWNIEFLHPHREFAPTDWFAYQARTRQAGAGYAHTEANIWDQYGQLIALSRQTVGVFD